MIPKNAIVGDLIRLHTRKKYASLKDRMLAVILRRQGKSYRKIAGEISRSADFVKVWNDRFKEQGAIGLLDKRMPAKSDKLTDETRNKFKIRVLTGPTIKDGMSAFTRVDLKRILDEEFSVAYSLSAIGKLLRRLNIVKLRPRPIHEKNVRAKMDEWRNETLPIF